MQSEKKHVDLDFVGAAQRAAKRHGAATSGDMSAVAQAKRLSTSLKPDETAEPSGARRVSKYSTAKVTYDDLKGAGLLDESERMGEIKRKKQRATMVRHVVSIGDSDDEDGMSASVSGAKSTPSKSPAKSVTADAWEDDSDDGDDQDESDDDW